VNCVDLPFSIVRSERIGNLDGSQIMGFFGLGELPKEYNRKIHGPYDPAVYYGKSNTN